MRSWRFSLALAVGLVAPAGTALAQVIDSPGGSVQMLPGGAVGKGDKAGIGSHDAAAPGKPEFVPTSQEEQQSRRLIELKEQRAELAGKLGGSDSQVLQLDAQLTELRQSMAQQTLAAKGAADATVAAEDASQGLPEFPRIVTPVLDEVTSYQTTSDSSPGESAESAAARRALETSRVSVVAQAQPVSLLLQSLQTQTGTHLDINWKALAVAGVEPAAPVSINLQEVSGSKALSAVLSAAGGATATLGYTVVDGTVSISTAEDLNSSRYQTVRVYDVRDLLGRNLYDYPTMYALQMYGSQSEMLQDTIKSVVDPNSWRDAGGTVGSIRELNGSLIINQTGDNHLAIARLLAKVRQR